MKYAKEVIDLLAAYPGRQFRMTEIVRHVSRARMLSTRERNAMRQAILRVLASLEDSGQVMRAAPASRSAVYWWVGICDMKLVQSATGIATIGAG